MRVVAIIQARMGSTRLPGKVLKDLCGATVLARVVNRTGRATLLDEIVVATTVKPADEAIVQECERLSVACFRGDEADVLDRYYRAAQHFFADAIVRITSDCPLIDPEVVDKTIRAFLEERPDYASNTCVPNYPRGLDTEVTTLAALQSAWTNAIHPYQRSHVTPYIYENPKKFRVLSVMGDKDNSGHRWTVDTPEDLEFVRAVYSCFRDDRFLLSDVLKLMEREPQLAEINREVEQKSLCEG
ncbi:MAG: glycosyltransferase family protein [Candidatus Sulfotelmatobacter sp.]